MLPDTHAPLRGADSALAFWLATAVAEAAAAAALATRTGAAAPPPLSLAAFDWLFSAPDDLSAEVRSLLLSRYKAARG